MRGQGNAAQTATCLRTRGEGSRFCVKRAAPAFGAGGYGTRPVTGSDGPVQMRSFPAGCSQRRVFTVLRQKWPKIRVFPIRSFARPKARLLSCLRTDAHALLPHNSNQRSDNSQRMTFTVFLGNLPVWVTADDIQSWLTAEGLVADAIKVIRNPETQESKGFAFIEAPNNEEMQAIIRRFDRAPLEGRLLRANPAQPPRPKGSKPEDKGPRSNDRRPGGHRRTSKPEPKSAFAAELAKAL